MKQDVINAQIEKLTAIMGRLPEKFGEVLSNVEIRNEELNVLVLAPKIVDVLSYLKDIEGFSTLIDITAVDFPESPERFAVVYHLLSMNNNIRIRVKAFVPDGTAIATVVNLWPGANWYEREVFDMYGVLFDGHPDMRRILTDYGFEGHPLRKDFPLTGYQEVRYDEEQKRIVYEPVKLVQEFRNFDFLSPWEGMLPGDEKAETAEGAK